MSFATTETETVKTDTETTSPEVKPTNTYSVAMRPQEILNWLIKCPDVMADDFYADSIKCVYESKSFTAAETFPLLISAIRSNNAKRVSQILSLGQRIFNPADESLSRLLVWDSWHILSAVLLEDVAVAVVKNIPLETLRPIVTGNIPRINIFEPLSKTVDPANFVIARDFFVGLNSIPSGASMEMMIECGRAGVYNPINEKMVKAILNILDNQQAVLDTARREISEQQAKVSSADSTIVDLETQVASKDSTIADLNQSKSNLETQVASKDSTITDLTTKNALLLAELAQVREHVILAHTKNDELSDTLKATIAVFSSVREKLQNL